MTIKDIARESGYAVGTVSRVLNNHPEVSDTARKKIMEVVDKYHFRLNSNAKHLKQQASKGVTIIVKGSQNMLFAAILERMQGLLEEKGYACRISYIGEEENEVEQALQVCRELRPLGLLFLGSNLEYFRERFSEVPVPCVLATNSAGGLGFENLSSVGTDDASAAAAAIDHLVSLGHVKIGILGGQMESSQAAYTRYQGCKQALASHRIVFDPERQYEAALFSMQAGYQALERLMEKMPDLTAVFAMSDVMAVGAVRAIRDKGRQVPGDISVVGFDGIELSQYLTPKLTTIRQDRERIADRSVELLIESIGEGKAAAHEVVPFRVIVGESTGKL